MLKVLKNKMRTVWVWLPPREAVHVITACEKSRSAEYKRNGKRRHIIIVIIIILYQTWRTCATYECMIYPIE